MLTSDLMIRLLVLAVITAGLHLLLKDFQAPKIKIRTVLILHVTVLALFFTGVLGNISLTPVTDILFDVIWWTLALAGLKTSISLTKHFTKLDYCIILTTIVFLLFIPLMVLVSNM